MKKAQSILSRAKQKVDDHSRKLSVLGVTGLAAAGSSSAHAVYTMPTGASDAFVTVTEMYTAFETEAWKVIPVIILGFVAIKLFKRFTRSAT